MSAVHYLHWEVDGTSGCTAVRGSRNAALQHFADYFKPFGYRLTSITNTY